MKTINWLGRPIQGILLDITGVLYESGEHLGTVIAGSIEAVQKLRENEIPFRLLTNESASTNEAVIRKLNHHGYSFVNDEIFSPIPAMKSIMKKNNLHPFLLVHPDVQPEFSEFEQTKPNCVVMADAVDELSFGNMNKAFNSLLAMEKPLLYTLGKGKYYRHQGHLQLDVGPFATALEYACDVKATVIGKPSEEYFKAALDDMGISAQNAVMIGDDIDSDVGGAQRCDVKAVLVKTGKFSTANLNHPTVKPDLITDNLLSAITYFIDNK